MGLVPAIHVLWEDKSTAGIATTHSRLSSSTISTSPFTSSSSSFTSRGSSFTGTAVEEESPQDPEPPPTTELEAKETLPSPAETITEEKKASEEPLSPTDPTEEAESFSAPEVTASAHDPEDDKWTSFPDISFPSAK